MSPRTALRYERRDAHRAVDAAQKNLGLTDGELAKRLDVDRRTILRYRKEATTPSGEVRQRIQALRDLFYLLDQIFPTSDAAKDWLDSPVPRRRSRAPIDLHRAGKLEVVIHELVAGLDAGVFT